MQQQIDTFQMKEDTIFYSITMIGLNKNMSVNQYYIYISGVTLSLASICS